MALLNRKNNQPHTPAESYWKEVKKQVHSLVAETLDRIFPLTDPNKHLDLEQDVDYLHLLTDYRKEYSDNLPETEQVAHEIAYEYLLMIIKSLVKTLKEFTCHEPEYLENLIS